MAARLWYSPRSRAVVLAREDPQPSQRRAARRLISVWCWVFLWVLFWFEPHRRGPPTPGSPPPLSPTLAPRGPPCAWGALRRPGAVAPSFAASLPGVAHGLSPGGRRSPPARPVHGARGPPPPRALATSATAPRAPPPPCLAGARGPGPLRRSGRSYLSPCAPPRAPPVPVRAAAALSPRALPVLPGRPTRSAARRARLLAPIAELPPPPPRIGAPHTGPTTATAKGLRNRGGPTRCARSLRGSATPSRAARAALTWIRLRLSKRTRVLSEGAWRPPSMSRPTAQAHAAPYHA
jgi:hypothetical protein